MLSEAESIDLASVFAYVTNYGADDVLSPVDPLTYRAPDGDTCLHIAARMGNLRAVELLVREGLDVNAEGDMENTPLHYASTPEVVHFLLAHGANPKAQNRFGAFPEGCAE